MSSPVPTRGRVVAIDWGVKRSGVAVSDPEQMIGQPLGTLVRRPGKRFPLNQLKMLTADLEPVGYVVGLPLESDGTEGEFATEARQTGEAIARATALPVEMWDERMSTARALSAIRDMQGSTRGRKGDVDSMAAALILQAWLESRRIQPDAE